MKYQTRALSILLVLTLILIITPSKVFAVTRYVSYYPNGGKFIEDLELSYDSYDVSVESGSIITPPEIKRPGYSLKGWYYYDPMGESTGSKFDFSKTITQDTYLIAHWTAIVPTGVSLDQNRIDLLIGEETTLKATVAPAGASLDEWTTSDAEVAKVKNGVVTAIGSGSAIITAKAGSKKAECIVVVTAKEHSHSIEYTQPVWKWKYDNDTWSATSTYTGECECGETVTETFDADIEREDSDAGYKYIATDAKGNKDEKSFTYSFKVTYTEDQDQAAGTYQYGDTCKLVSDRKSDWSIDGTIRAKGTTNFYFPVTGNVTVTRIVSQEEVNAQVHSNAILLAEGGQNRLKYKFVWSIPEGSQVKSAMIYRCKDNDSKIKTADALLAASNLRSYDTKMFVRNGEYTFTATNLTSNTSQTIMFRVIYTLNGETIVMDTDISHIPIQ